MAGNEKELKLPKANLITAMNGGKDALKSMIENNSSHAFNGYIKVTMRVGTEQAKGIIVLVKGQPDMAYYVHENDRTLGQEALPKIFELTLSRKCVLKLYSFPFEVQKEIEKITEKFGACRIDTDKFWEQIGGSDVVSASVPGAGGAAGVMDRPRVDEVMEEAEDAFKSMVDQEMVVVEDADEEEGEGTPIDNDRIGKVEMALKDREETIRKEIEKKLEEREELKKEEDKFLKMDEVFSKLIKERDEEIKKKEKELKEKEEELRRKEEKIEQLEGKEEDLVNLKKELKKHREEMKQREDKLKEMEKMFRRVLANTEERLKKKEEELILKEEELKQEVKERMRLIDDLKLREARVLEMEQQIKASEAGSEIVDDELKNREKKIEELEENLKKAKESMDDLRREMKEQKGMHEDVKECLKVLDDLLGKLPDEIVTEFAESGNFELYEKIMNHFELGGE